MRCARPPVRIRRKPQHDPGPRKTTCDHGARTGCARGVAATRHPAVRQPRPRVAADRRWIVVYWPRRPEAARLVWWPRTERLDGFDPEGRARASRLLGLHGGRWGADRR